MEPTGHEAMRFILDESALTEPGALAARTILGPGIEHDPRTLVEHGFVHRVRCVSDGVQRRVHIGTQHRDGTDWFDLDEVELTREGLSTPAVAEIRRRRTQSVLIGVRSRDVAAKAAAAPAPPIGVQQVVEDRAAVFAARQEAVGDNRSVTRLQRCLDRAEAVSMHSATAAERADAAGGRRAAESAPRRGCVHRAPGSTSVAEAALPGRASSPCRVAYGGQGCRELLNTLEQHSRRKITAVTVQFVERLARRAEVAGMWLGFPERDAVAAWKRRVSHEAGRTTEKRLPRRLAAPRRRRRWRRCPQRFWWPLIRRARSSMKRPAGGRP